MCPATHVGLEICNDAIATFEDKVKELIVVVTEEDQRIHERLEALKTKTVDRRETVNRNCDNGSI